MQVSREKPREEYQEKQVVGGTYAKSTVPELERQRQARIKRLQELEQQQIALHKKRLHDGVIGRRKNAKAYDAVTVIMAAATAVLLMFSVLIYVGRNANLNASNKKVAALKQQYEQLRTDNDNRESILNSSIDVQQVYRVATQDLGMSYPEKHQVITYHKKESGYVAQYEDIPE